jgi:hypothetical protein
MIFVWFQCLACNHQASLGPWATLWQHSDYFRSLNPGRLPSEFGADGFPGTTDRGKRL